MALLEVKNIKKYYHTQKNLFSNVAYVRAVDDVSFTVEKGETVGLVGESGCGKTTLGKLILGLEKPTSGEVLLNSLNLSELSSKEIRKVRKDFQMIFQDPYSSLNPRMNILKVLDEVLMLHSSLKKEERFKKIKELISLVGLKEEHLYRFPHQFSGGQRQRIGIARALAVEPSFIIADEPVSALDVSIQAQIINLLDKIKKDRQISFLFIAHDLAVVEHVSDKILVMYLGKIVEYGTAEQVCKYPAHPYTKVLLSAVVNLEDQKRSDESEVIEGDIPSPLNPPSGCYFHTRCKFARDICKNEQPKLTEINNSGHFSACFFNRKQ